MPNTLIVIAGATATGKTSLAIGLARALNTEIISADSRQCYRELNIGVARPSPCQLASIPHHFIGSHSIEETVTAISFEQYALAKLETIFAGSSTAVVVGGTGLYIKALTDGLDSIPEVSSSIRAKIVEGYNSNGLTWLQQTVQQEDPYFYVEGETLNPRRLMRALEIIRGTGRSIRSFKTNQAVSRPFNIIRYNLVLPKPRLHQQIDRRVDEMVNLGLFNEAKSLLPYEHLQALQTVGYKEIFDHYHGLASKQEAIDKIKTHTRQYAKRQITWFKKDERFVELDGETEHNELVSGIKRDIASEP